MSPSKTTRAAAELAWLRELLGDVPGLPEQQRPRPYWSQRTSSSPAEPEPWPSVVHRLRALINEFERDHYFAEVLGYDCVDGNGQSDSSVEHELGSRVGKPDLLGKADADWSESDLCDFIEVFHDLAARPTRGWYHDFCNCGFHPARFSRKSGQALYRWRVNRLLDGTSLDVRLAEEGEDIGRMIRVAPAGVAQLTSDALTSSTGEDRDEVAHAVALFRARDASRHQQRSAIVALAGILEHRRALLKEELPRKDEAPLFEIANKFDLRHRKPDQHADYDDAFLEWVFYWYLATVHLTNQLIARQGAIEDDPSSP